MIDRFMILHNEGHDLKEIAKICRVSYKTVLRYLDDIARDNHVTRDSLLTRIVFADHSNGRNYSPVRPIDSSKFVADISLAREKAYMIWAKTQSAIENIGLLEEV